MRVLVASLVSLVVLAGAAGCSDESKAAASSALPDLEKLAPEQLKSAANEVVDDAAAKLDQIKDAANVKSVTTELEPLLAKLEGFKSKLGASGLDLSRLKKAMDDLVTRAGGNPELTAAIEPLVSKLRALVG